MGSLGELRLVHGGDLEGGIGQGEVERRSNRQRIYVYI